MPPIEIKVRENGPYKVTGPVTLIDADGNRFELPDDGRPVALCRCGGSAASNPIFECVPSQNGLVVEPPQRQRATGRPSSGNSNRLPSASMSVTGPVTL